MLVVKITLKSSEGYKMKYESPLPNYRSQTLQVFTSNTSLTRDFIVNIYTLIYVCVYDYVNINAYAYIYTCTIYMYLYIHILHKCHFFYKQYFDTFPFQSTLYFSLISLIATCSTLNDQMEQN